MKQKKQQHDFEVRCLSVTGSCSHHSYNMAQRIIHEATLISNSTKVENLTIFGKNEVWMKEKCAEGRWDLSFNLRPRVKRSFTAVVLLSELLWTWYTCVVDVYKYILCTDTGRAVASADTHRGECQCYRSIKIILGHLTKNAD